MRRSVGTAVGILGCALLLVIALCVWRSHQETIRAEHYHRAEQSNQGLAGLIVGPANAGAAELSAAQLSDYLMQEASRHYSRALKWQVHSKQADQGIRELANQAERAGFRERALKIYREYRSAIMASDHLWQPRQKTLAELNEHLVALLGGSEQDKRQWAQELEAPRPFFRGWQAGMVGAFFAWLISVTWLIWKGFDPAGKPRSKVIGFSLAVSMGFLGIWLTCLSQIKLGK